MDPDWPVEIDLVTNKLVQITCCNLEGLPGILWNKGAPIGYFKGTRDFFRLNLREQGMALHTAAAPAVPAAVKT